MSRTYQQMIDAAYVQRHAMLKDGREPYDGEFPVTEEEYCTLKMNWVGAYSGKEPERICGLKLKRRGDA